MTKPGSETDEARTRLLLRLASGLKIALIISIYFSLCVLIILVIIGAKA